ncbi:MAG: tRNA pseudouridine(38-40) synthase TruA [Halothiobacillaceae bacterium]
MPRIVLGIEYDGRRYHGWQSQREVDSVQARLEAALSRVADHPVETVCAGRTDRGVHATQQVVHFDTPAQRSLRGWQLGTVQNLPDDITVLWAREVDEHFHARFSAVRRQYRYVILNRLTRPALQFGRVTWWYPDLDADLMDAGARHLLGRHDFTSFRGRDCQAHSPWRTLEAVAVRRRGDYLFVDVRANAFLHHMVRNIVGSLLEVGQRERDPAWMGEVLAARDRDAAGITAPADGLYLVHVGYPAESGLALSARLPVFADPEEPLPPPAG